MRALTAEEAKIWCTRRGLRIDESGRPHFQDRSKNDVWFPLQKDAYRLPFEITGAEYLLWITQWGIWQNWVESTGLEHFAALRREFGYFRRARGETGDGFLEFRNEDRYIGVSTIDEATALHFSEELKGWGAEPKGLH